MTMSFDSAQATHAGVKMQIEMEMWLASDVPGAHELRAFYQKNADHFPWTALAAGGKPGMQKSMAQAQKRIASMGGVPVLQIVRMKMNGAQGLSADQSAKMQQGMGQARAKLEEMAKQGGPQGAAAQQALARMGGLSASPAGGFEMTMESHDFSTAAIPDSVFAIPAGYQKTEKTTSGK